MRLNVLSSGVDSLYLSFAGKVSDDWLDVLEELKLQAQSNDEPARVPLAWGDFLVQPTGWNHYRYWLHCPDLDIFVTPGHKLPPAYVKLASSYLHTVGADAAVTDAEALVKATLVRGNEQPQVSRVDLYADFQGWVPTEADYLRFVTRSSRNAEHLQSARGHFHRRSFTGFQFGRDQLLARLYDKTVEITGTDKQWIRDVWGERFDPERHVWRLEFQFRRDVIRDFRVGAAHQALTRLQALWRYGTKWLSLRVPTENAQRYRWPVAPEWLELSQVQIGVPSHDVVRIRVREHREDVLVRGAAGYVSSFAALNGIRDWHEATTSLGKKVYLYLHERDQTFRSLVARKQAQLV